MKIGVTLFFCLALSHPHLLFGQNHSVSRDSVDSLLVEAKRLTHKNPTLSVEFAERGLALSREIGTTDQEGYALNILGVVSNVQGDYNQALEHLLNAIQIHEINRDSVNLFKAYSGLALVYKYIGEFHKAISFNKKALLFNASGNARFEANALNNIGVAYKNLDDLDSAYFYFDRSLTLKKENNLLIGIANSLTNLGNIKAMKFEYKEAVNLFSEALNLEISEGSSEGIAKSHNNLGLAYLKMNLLDSAIHHARIGFKIGKEIETKIQIKEATEVLSKAYSQKGNFEQAFEFLTISNQMKDSLSNEDQAKEIGRLEAKLDLDRKNTEIRELAIENEIQQLQAERAAQTRLILIILAVALVVIVILFYSRFRGKSRSNALLDAKNQELVSLNRTKDRLFSIISHDLKSPLSSFHTITSSLTSNWDHLEKEQLKEFIESLRDSSANVRDMMDNLLKWALTQTNQLSYNPTKVQPQQVIEEVLLQVQTSATLKEIIFQTNVMSTTAINADQQFLEIIIRNLLNNALKFSEMNSEISILVEEQEQMLCIQIRDEGIGMNQSQLDRLLAGEIVAHDIQNSTEKGTGLGLTLCNELMTKMGASMKVSSEESEGTTFQLIFQIAT